MRILLLCLLLAGCSSTETIVDTNVVEKTNLHPERSEPVFVTIPEMVILNAENIDQEVEKLKADGQFTVTVYTWQDYLKIVSIVDQLLLKIEKQNVTICYYRKELDEKQCKEEIKND